LPYSFESIGGIETHVKALTQELIMGFGVPVSVVYRGISGKWTMIPGESVSEAHDSQCQSSAFTATSIERGDLLHIHGLARWPLSQLIRKIPGDVPIVFSPHGSFWSELVGADGVKSMFRAACDPFVAPSLIKRCRSLLVATSAEKSVMLGLMRKWRVDVPVSVEPLPVDLDFGDTTVQSSGSRPTRLVALGRQDKIKGFECLADAVATYPDLPPCDIVGPAGNATRVLRKLAERAPSGRIRLLPPITTGEAKVKLLAGAQAVVVPSRFESFSLVANEALALHVPVVISDKVAMVVSAPDVRVFEYGSVRSLVGAIRSLPARDREMGMSYSHSSIRTYDDYARSLVRLYLEVSASDNSYGL
jgi:glycosyltransferase involved in cell wall biosynthesis